MKQRIDCKDCEEEITEHEINFYDGRCQECSDELDRANSDDEPYECPDLSSQGNTFGTFIGMKF